jgi:hypothetical protein
MYRVGCLFSPILSRRRLHSTPPPVNTDLERLRPGVAPAPPRCRPCSAPVTLLLHPSNTPALPQQLPCSTLATPLLLLDPDGDPLLDPSGALCTGLPRLFGTLPLLRRRSPPIPPPVPPVMHYQNTANQSVVHMGGRRPAVEGGGPLGNEQLDRAIGPRLGGGWRPVGGRGSVERHGVLDVWRGRRSIGRRWRGWTSPVDLGTTGEEGNRR